MFNQLNQNLTIDYLRKNIYTMFKSLGR